MLQFVRKIIIITRPYLFLLAIVIISYPPKTVAKANDEAIGGGTTKAGIKAVIDNSSPSMQTENNENNAAPEIKIIDSPKQAQNQKQIMLISIDMKAGQIKLNDYLKSFLGDHVLKRLHEDGKIYLMIRGYASPKESEPFYADRISLARALEIRQFLLDNSIEAKRIKIELMTKDEDNKKYNKITDRIDILFLK